MKILAIDIGKTTGWSFNQEEGGEIKFKSLHQYYTDVQNIVQLYKPELVVSCKPNRFYNTIFSHGKMMGIVELVCEKQEVQYLEFYDPEVKKGVFGKGRIDKEEVLARFGGDSFDEADARMFIEFAKQKCYNTGNEKSGRKTHKPTT